MWREFLVGPTNPAEEFSSGFFLKEKFLPPLILEADQLAHLSNVFNHLPLFRSARTS